MTETQINTALRQFLIEPLTMCEATIIYAGHIGLDDATKSAFDKYTRNLALPRNFTTSLDACAIVEWELSVKQCEKYAALLNRRHGKFLALFAPPLIRATALVEVLELTPDE